MKNISLKKIQKTIEKNRMQLMEIEKEIRKNSQIQIEIDKREKEIEKKLSAINAEIKGVFSYYNEISFSVKMEILTSKNISKYLWNEFQKPHMDSFYYEIKPYKAEYRKIKKQFENLKEEEGKLAKNLLKLYDQKEIIEQNIDNLENTLFDSLNENEIKILELF